MATVITRTLGPGLTVSGTINENGIIIYTITLPSGKTVIVTDDELGSLRITQTGPNAWLFTVGTLAVGSSISSDDAGAILTLEASRAQIAAIGVELKNEQPLGTTDPPDEEDETVENPDPEDVTDPDELDDYGYEEPDDEEGPELLTPPDVDDQDELDDYGIDDELTLDPEPDYGTEPDDLTDDQTEGYGGAPDDGDEQVEFGGDQDETGPGSSRGLFGARAGARSVAFIQDQYKTNKLADWRVSLTLAPDSNYLYNAPAPGILAPLKATNGVIFPYTPAVQLSYAANYDAVNPTHSNYKIFQYTSSAVDNVTITGEFTAQDTFEANYLLAVIHFFRSLTKMFYGQDEDPRAGTPPPLVFLDGLGAFQYNGHPLVINNFQYSLPTDVDYIRAFVDSKTTAQVNSRLGSTIAPGGVVPKIVFTNDPKNEIRPTYVPTKISLTITAFPIVTRNRISNEFSLEEYGSGDLLNKGIW